MGNNSPKMPPDKKWTPEQWLGISETGKSLLVSAAAGSGKTTVLAERCVYLVCDAPKTCEVDQLLVVTFTEKTADQMRTRITNALRERASKKPKEDLQKHLALIDQAQISTLHAFCARLLRQHFHLVGLDPGFTVMAADEARLLRREVAQALFERRYDDEDGHFQRLIDGYGNGDDQRVMQQVLHVHDLLTSVVNPGKWISDARERIDAAIENPLEETELGQELLRVIERGLDALCRRTDTAIETVRGLAIPKYLEYVTDMRATFRYWEAAYRESGIDALVEVAGEVEWPKLASVKSDVPGKELGKSLIDALRDEATASTWRNMLRFTSDQWRAGLQQVRRHSDVFLDLVEQFTKEYGDAKKQMRSVDFADLERFTLQVLCKSPAEPGEPSNAARAFHKRFEHVLVDEFQDINEVQDAILSLISRECLTGKSDRAFSPNLFCVGDVKQSIYRFRLAEARRFLDRQQTFREETSHGRVIDLQANFRSRRPLLEAINSVFARLMTAEAVDIEYDQTHRLMGMLAYPDLADGQSFPGAPIDLHILPDAAAVEESTGATSAHDDDGEEVTRTEREAIVVAQQIQRMLGLQPGTQPMQVMERGPDGSLQPRKATFRDVVVLLRSMQFKGDQFADVLSQHAIPVFAASNTGYFASMEVRDMMSLLRLLDNQRQDIPLAAVLRSPLAKFAEPEATLSRIRLAYDSAIPFHEAAMRYAQEKADDVANHLQAFYERLDRWRRAAQLRPIADVIWSIYHETGYLAYVSGLRRGEQRAKNLMNLHERAAEFGEFQSRGLSRFMRFLEQLQEETDVGQPSTASEAEDVVRIMTVHAAKGLEFPIVFVPDLGKRINLQSCQGPILADRSAGLGMVVVDEQKRCRYPSLASTLVQSRLRQQSLAEELRVLYVAMTRAKEHLVLIGTAKKKLAEAASRWLGHAGSMPTEGILSASTMLDWICPVEAMTRAERQPVFRLAEYAPEELASWKTPASARISKTPEQLAMAELQPLNAPPPADEIAAKVIERISFEYPHDAYSKLPATQSVTASAHQPITSERAEPMTMQFPAVELALPQFIERSALAATDRGTATHLVLQYLDFQTDCDKQEIEAQIKALVARRVIGQEAADAVDVTAIAWLLADPVGKLLRRGRASVLRELPVTFPRPAEPVEGNAPLDRVMVRGRIDTLILCEGNSATLLDYKTDNVTKAGVHDRAEFYRPQLYAYRDAISAITNVKIDGIYLAFLSPRVMQKL